MKVFAQCSSLKKIMKDSRPVLLLYLEKIKRIFWAALLLSENVKGFLTRAAQFKTVWLLKKVFEDVLNSAAAAFYQTSSTFRRKFLLLGQQLKQKYRKSSNL